MTTQVRNWLKKSLCVFLKKKKNFYFGEIKRIRKSLKFNYRED